jgi:NAD(P)-dependent dehydrogenase (short-subunit alcohol dehydrogenase family)
MMRRAIPRTIEQGSRSIVNIASTAGLGGASAGVAYTACKLGLVGLTRNTAWVYATTGVRCNAICTGGTHQYQHNTQYMPAKRCSHAHERTWQGSRLCSKMAWARG